MSKQDLSIKQLFQIAEALEKFKLKIYERLGKGDKEFDDFVMNNAPCNYNLDTIEKKLKELKII